MAAIHYSENWSIKKLYMYCFPNQNVSQGNQIADDRKFLFVDILQLKI